MMMCGRRKAMKTAVYGKFLSFDEFGFELTSIKYKGKTFVEASPFDRIWGIGFGEENAPDDETLWEGMNLLGKVLTEIRDEYVKTNGYAGE